MLDEVVQLERLRQEIEDAEYSAGDRSDYLDRGNPNPRQAKAAREQMAASMKKAEELKLQLHNLIAATRQANPRAVEEWVEFHKNLLQPILLEKPKDASSKARLNIANQTRDEWDKVLNGTQHYVAINWYFLKDYRTKSRDLPKKVENLPKNVEDSTKKDGRAWWQVWR